MCVAVFGTQTQTVRHGRESELTYPCVIKLFLSCNRDPATAPFLFQSKSLFDLPHSK